jgi:hypothetical protein
MKLLEAPYDELREAGLSYDFIAKTSAVLQAWSEKLLNPDETEFGEKPSEQIESKDGSSSEAASDLFSMFFADDEYEGEDDIGGDDDGE